MEKLPIFDQNHGITRFEKSQFADFFNFLFIFLAYFAYNKKIEKLPIFDQNHGLTPFENVPTF